MFSQASVILFTGVCVCVCVCVSQYALEQKRPWLDSPGQTPPWADTRPGQHPPSWADTLQEDTPLGTHPPTATTEDGTHPTGIHSCCNL